MNKKWLLILPVLAGIFIGFRTYYFFTDDFRLSNITYDLPRIEEYQTTLPSESELEDIKNILEQPFYYYGKGGQVYVFKSEDNKYILKFFKFKHIRPSFLVEWMPPYGFLKEYKIRKIAEKNRKVHNLFKGYKYAHEFDKENSGLVFVHLNKESDYRFQTVIYDKIGGKYKLELDDYVFVLQRKGVTLKDTLHALLKQNDIDQAIKKVHTILNMYVEQYKKGIYDRDHGVVHNTGFIGDAPLHFDVGKFSISEDYKNRDVFLLDLGVVALKLKRWLDKSYPDKSPLVMQGVDQYFYDNYQHVLDFDKIVVDYARIRKNKVP